jgi:hypothetical protein
MTFQGLFDLAQSRAVNALGAAKFPATWSGPTTELKRWFGRE